MVALPFKPTIATMAWPPRNKVGPPFSQSTSSRPWKNAKARLTFCKVTQDGDWEGCLHLDRLPTADEAVVIREVLGLRKRRHMPAEALSKLERTRGLIKSPNLAPHSTKLSGCCAISPAGSTARRPVSPPASLKGSMRC